MIHAGLAAAFTARAGGEPADRRHPLMAGYFVAADQAVGEHVDTPMLPSVELAGARAQIFSTLSVIPPPHPAAILGVEMLFSTTLDEEPVTGVVDLALRTGATSAHIREWKTGLVSWEPVDDDALPLYGEVARQRWPWIKTITVGLFSTRSGREQVQALEPAHSSALRQRLVADAQWERTARPRLSTATVDALFPMVPGGHCGGCLFRSYCPQFRGVTDLPMRPGVDAVTERNRLAQKLERHP